MNKRSRTYAARRCAAGQSLVLVAVVLPVVLAFVLTCVEVGTRLLQRAEVEDALRAASRTAIQTFVYAPFAEGMTAVRTEDVRRIATHTFATNLAQAHGLTTSPAETAAAVHWEPITNTNVPCLAPNGQAVVVTPPALCATVQLRMQGFIGWGEWRSTLFVAETLDQVR